MFPPDSPFAYSSASGSSFHAYSSATSTPYCLSSKARTQSPGTSARVSCVRSHMPSRSTNAPLSIRSPPLAVRLPPSSTLIRAPTTRNSHSDRFSRHPDIGKNEEIVISSAMEEPPYALPHPILHPPTSPAPISTKDAYTRISSWISDGCPGPIDIICTPSVFKQTRNLLVAKGACLPRLTRDYDPSTMTWHIRGRPKAMHEVGNSILRSIENLIMPKLTTGKLSRLTSGLLWFMGSTTCKLPVGGTKEPDASMGMRHRGSPTVVIEVGYTETLTKLRIDARRWLGTADKEQKRKREEGEGRDADIRPVMLVILISFEGQRPTEEPDIVYSPRDFLEEGDDTGGGENNKKPKALEIYVELWRNRPVADSRPLTREAATHEPQCCQRERFYPTPVDEREYITLYASDLFGGDMVHDAKGKYKWDVPLSVFKGAYEDMLSVWRAQKGINDADEHYEPIVASDSEEEEERGENDTMDVAGVDGRGMVAKRTKT